jgi:hypothetical protein
MNYYASRYNGCGGGIRFDEFMVGISPNQSAIKL